jgi:hypothetical protein
MRKASSKEMQSSDAMTEPKKYRNTDIGDGVHVVYIPWEDSPFGHEPKPEGYDEFYAEFGLGPLIENGKDV